MDWVVTIGTHYSIFHRILQLLVLLLLQEVHTWWHSALVQIQKIQRISLGVSRPGWPSMGIHHTQNAQIHSMVGFIVLSRRRKKVSRPNMKKEIIKWMKEFVEVPNAKLGNWAPCPYARKARLDKQIEIVEGESLLYDFDDIDLDAKEVYVFWYRRQHYTVDELTQIVKELNERYMEEDMVFLEDHPDDDEIINGERMNFGSAILVIVQRLSKLNEASDALSKTDYYKHWSKKNLRDVKDWRYE